MQIRSKRKPTLDEVLQHLRYVPESGDLYWLDDLKVANGAKSRVAGKRAGYPHDGYTIIEIGYGEERMRNRAHVLIWLMVTGEWPEGQIDHINGNRSDNRMSNLRIVTQSENNQNRANVGIGKSGLLGVWYRPSRKWAGGVTVCLRPYRSAIRIPATGDTPSKTMHLGSYFTAEEAHNAYLDAKRKYHPASSRIDIPDDMVVPERVKGKTYEGKLLSTDPYMCNDCGESDPAKFVMHFSRSRCNQCIVDRRTVTRRANEQLKHYTCKRCGVTGVELFFPSNRRACKECLKAGQAASDARAKIRKTG